MDQKHVSRRGRWPQFSLFQLMLLAALASIVAGAYRAACQIRLAPSSISVALAPQGQWLAATFEKGSPRVWKIGRGSTQSLACPRFAARPILSESIRSAGESRFFVVVAEPPDSVDSRTFAEVWDVATDQRCLRIPLGESWESETWDAFAASEAGRVITVCPDLNLIDSWNAATGERLYRVAIPQDIQLRYSHISPDGTLIRASQAEGAPDGSDADHEILFDLEGVRVLRRFQPGDSLYAIGTSSLAWITVSTADDDTRLESLHVGSLERDAPLLSESITRQSWTRSVKLSQDGNTILRQFDSYSGEQEEVDVWDVAHHSPRFCLKNLELNQPIFLCGTGLPWQRYAYSQVVDLANDGSCFATAGTASVQVFDARTGRLVATPYIRQRRWVGIVYAILLVGWAVAWAYGARPQMIAISPSFRFRSAQALLVASGGYLIFVTFLTFRDAEPYFSWAEAFAALVGTNALAGGLAGQWRAMLLGALTLFAPPMVFGTLYWRFNDSYLHGTPLLPTWMNWLSFASLPPGPWLALSPMLLASLLCIVLLARLRCVTPAPTQP